MRTHDPFGTCRNCGCHIMWVKTKAGKNMPVDPTMISYRRPEAGAKAKEKIVTPEGEVDRKSTRLNSSHPPESRMPSSA